MRNDPDLRLVALLLLLSVWAGLVTTGVLVATMHVEPIPQPPFPCSPYPC